jgi:hypothetical protein
MVANLRACPKDEVLIIGYSEAGTARRHAFDLLSHFLLQPSPFTFQAHAWSVLRLLAPIGLVLQCLYSLIHSIYPAEDLVMGSGDMQQ